MQAKCPPKSIIEEATRLRELQAQVAQRLKTAEVVEDARSLEEDEREGSPPSGANIEAPPDSLGRLLRNRFIHKEGIGILYTKEERQARQSNKENIDIASRSKAFVDRQDSAQRVCWKGDTQEVTSDTPLDNVSSLTRPRNHVQVINDDDDDFEAATAATADKRRRDLHDKTGQRTTTEHAPSERPETPELVHAFVGRTVNADHEPDIKQSVADKELADADSSPVRSSRRPPTSFQPPPNASRRGDNTDSPPPTLAPPAITGQHLAYVRQRAQENVATRNPRPVQSRTAYTAAEEERLVDLIERHGISYSLIKKKDDNHANGSLLHERTQVQLKDKAQELKFQFLK